MPIKKSAKKALRQGLKHAIKNVKIKETIKELIKKSKKLIEAKDQSAIDKIKATIKAIDQARQKGILKKNTGSRKKSRLMKKLNLMGK